MNAVIISNVLMPNYVRRRELLRDFYAKTTGESWQFCDCVGAAFTCVSLRRLRYHKFYNNLHAKVGD